MTRISQNPQFNQFTAGPFSQASRDRRIGPGEVRQLQNTIARMQSLSGEDKAAVNAFIQGLGDLSTHDNLFRTRRELSAVDRALLQAIATENPLAEQLLQAFETASGQPSTTASSENRVRAAADTPLENVSSLDFPAQATASTGAQPTAISQAAFETMRPEWYLNQYNTGLNSRGGDCGPTSAAMIARSFGYHTNLSERDAVDLARRESGGPHGSPRGGRWAIGTAEISRAVRELTGGQIRELGQDVYRPGQGEAVLQEIAQSLAQGNRPVLLTGVPGEGTPDYLHYMTAVGPDPSRPGHFLFADPALTFQTGINGVNDPRLDVPGGNAPSPRQVFTQSLSATDIEEMMRKAQAIGRANPATIIHYGPGR